MIIVKKLESIKELQTLYNRSLNVVEPISMHSMDDSIMADIKSFLGVMNLDYSQPIKIVTESQKYIDSIYDVGKNVDPEVLS